MSDLVPPPAVAAGGAPNLPAVPSYLNDAPTLRTPAGNTFTSYNAVPLPVEADVAFQQMAYPAGVDGVLSKHLPAYKITHLDRSQSLEPVTPFADVTTLNALVTQHGHWPTLCHFTMVERLPLLCGLITKEIHIEAWQIADRANRFIRYTSRTKDESVRIFKYRWITKGGEDGHALVHEYILGILAQRLFRSIAEKECRKMSLKHMEGYPELPFDVPPIEFAAPAAAGAAPAPASVAHASADAEAKDAR
jgi:hypothetical protein